MKYALLISLLFIVFFQTSCYYDDRDILDPDRGCDTAAVTYSGTINPILTANCTGCHSGANAPSGVKLDTHPNVRTQALAPSGVLLGAITHSAGFSPMPKNGNKLSDCSIEKIRKWIAAGAPNN